MKNLISTILLLTSLSLPVFSQPTVNGQFYLVTNNGTSYVVKVQISTNSGTNLLGDATIPFTFNNTNLTYVSTLFNNFSGGDYSTVNNVTISANRISLNIFLNNLSGGTVVSNTFMDVATITFSTIIPAGSSNLTFVPLLEFFSPNVTPPAVQWTNGTFTNLNTNPLPVELSSFTASSNQNGVNLKWETATEINNYGFDVERKVHTSTEFSPIKSGLSVTVWEKVGFVAGNGNSNSPKEYSFIDKNPSGGSKFQYRLKQIDNDGAFEYSDVVNVNVGTPEEYYLSQNYPNPFNPATTIDYMISNDEKVNLKVYDILGTEVATLVDEYKQAGSYSVTFNADNLSSGIYIYRLIAGEYISVNRMSLIK
jgi:hypothetical protein